MTKLITARGRKNKCTAHKCSKRPFDTPKYMFLVLLKTVEKMTQGVFFIADVNEDEWQDVDDGASVDSVEDEADEEAAQQDVDMVTSLVIH